MTSEASYRYRRDDARRDITRPGEFLEKQEYYLAVFHILWI